MNANEFRTGNYVYDCFTEKIITKIDLDDFQVINNYYRSNHPHPYQPIPLTEDIYKKIVYQLIEFKFFSKYQNRRITIILNDKLSIQSEYLHEFQNLYFALTKKELIL